MIRKWPVKQSRELHSKSKFLVTAEAYFSATFGSKISDFFDASNASHSPCVLVFRSSHVSFLFLVTFGDEVTKILHNLCLHFARQDGQDGKNGKKIMQPK